MNHQYSHLPGMLLVILLILVIFLQPAHAGFMSGTLSGEPLSFGDSNSSAAWDNGSANESLSNEQLSLLLSFIPNDGLTDPAIQYMVKGSGTTFAFTSDKILISMQKTGNITNASPVLITQSFPGANGTIRIEGEDLLPGTANFFLGNNTENWHQNLSTYGSIRYHDLYPGIDLVYRGNGSVLKREFLVNPGAKPDLIRMRYAGADSLSLDPAGNLNISAGSGSLIESRPVCYQEINGSEIAVGARYEISGGELLRIVLDPYNPAYPLVIDPNFVYSTYFGGSLDDEYGGCKIATDSTGNVYVIGQTRSENFPVSVSALQSSFGGYIDGVVLKLNPSGSRIYSTYLGGDSWDRILGITADDSGNVYLTGETGSSEFPITTGTAWQPATGGSCDVFFTKLDPYGALSYSTFYGGNGYDMGLDITRDTSGNVYITGETTGNFITTSGVKQPLYGGGSDDSFVLKFTSTGSLGYCTYLGGADEEEGKGIAVDSIGRAYVTGKTKSSNFPVTSGVMQSSGGGGHSDAFVTKLNPSGTDWVFSTYLGGTSWDDEGNSIAVDSLGYAYITGVAGSYNFPTTSGTFCDSCTLGGEDAFVTKLTPSGSCVYSSYLGGSSHDMGYTIAADSFGNAYVTGTTIEPFITTVPTIITGETYEVFITKVNPSGKSLVYSTFFGGGTGNEGGQGIAIDSSGNIYLSGYTSSTDFPVTTGAFQSSYAGGDDDLFIAKFSLPPGVTSSLNIGIFRSGMWLLDYNGNYGWNGAGTTSTTDRMGWLGQTGDTPLVGDWAGAGKKCIGIFRNGMFLLDYDGNYGWSGGGTSFDKDRIGWLGQSGDTPLVGDWNGDHKDEIGIFRGGMWLLDYNDDFGWSGDGSSATTDRIGWLGQSGDTPVVGDWNYDGKDEIGIFRNGMWLLDYDGNYGWSGGGSSATTDRIGWLGQSGDTPIVGDWRGNGYAKIGIFRGGMFLLDYSGNYGWDGDGSTSVTDRIGWLGQAGDTPLVGDWSGAGKDKIGIFRNGMWLLDYNGNYGWSGHGTTSTTDRMGWLGQTGDTPEVGAWSVYGAASLQTEKLNPQSVSPPQVPQVSALGDSIPKIEMPVKSSPVNPVKPATLTGAQNHVAGGLIPRVNVQ